jgi:hypothetical protein
VLVFAVAELSWEQGTAANRQITKLARGAMALWVKPKVYLGVSNRASPSQVLQLQRPSLRPVRALPASPTSLRCRSTCRPGSPEHQLQRHLSVPRQPQAGAGELGGVSWRCGGCEGVGRVASVPWLMAGSWELGAGSWRWLWRGRTRGSSPRSGTAVRVGGPTHVKRFKRLVSCVYFQKAKTKEGSPPGKNQKKDRRQRGERRTPRPEGGPLGGFCLGFLVMIGRPQAPSPSPRPCRYR